MLSLKIGLIKCNIKNLKGDKMIWNGIVGGSMVRQILLILYLHIMCAC